MQLVYALGCKKLMTEIARGWPRFSSGVEEDPIHWEDEEGRLAFRWFGKYEIFNKKELMIKMGWDLCHYWGLTWKMEIENF